MLGTEAQGGTGRACYTTSEVGQLLGIGRGKVRTMARNGEIPCIKTGRLFLFPKPAIEAWLKAARMSYSVDR